MGREGRRGMMCTIPGEEGNSRTNHINGGSERKGLLSLSWKGGRNG